MGSCSSPPSRHGYLDRLQQRRARAYRMADDEHPRAPSSVPRPRPRPTAESVAAAEYFDRDDSPPVSTLIPDPPGPRIPPRRPRRNASAALNTTIDALPGPIKNSLDAIGGMYSMAAASLYGLGSDVIHGKFQFKEFTERSWFLINATLLPAMLVSIPLGVAIALQVGALAAQIGATSFVGAADAIGVLREASPIVTALLLAGVAGSAVCAELGARTIREEIDAMIVLGLNPLRRLVAPLLVAGVLASALLNLIVIFVCIF